MVETSFPKVMDGPNGEVMYSLKKKPFPHLSNMFADSVTNCQCLSTKQSVKGHPSLEKACNILQNVKTTKIVFIIQREDKFLFY